MDVSVNKLQDSVGEGIPYWIVECTNEIEKTLKLKLDIDDSFMMASIISEHVQKNKVNTIDKACKWFMHNVIFENKSAFEGICRRETICDEFRKDMKNYVRKDIRSN